MVLKGYKCNKTGLWMVPLDTTARTTQMQVQENCEVLDHMQFANFAYEFLGNIIPTSSKEELAMYYHQCLCSPPRSTLLKAIRNGQLRSFPGLTYELIAKHLPPSTATEKGHMVRTRQGVRSTHSQRQDILDARLLVDDMTPTEQICTAMDDEMFCFAVLVDQNEGTIYSDLTG